MNARPITAAVAAFAVAGSAAWGHPHDPNGGGDPDHDHSNGWVHENGIGPDPDHDTNPATDTSIVPFIGDVLYNADGDAFPVIHFEPPPGHHGKKITTQYQATHGVRFSPGLSWQVCDGQRHFQYDSLCTYLAPTSGDFAAGYRDRLNRPLTIEFDRPVCLVSMSIYPTGGSDNEPFRFTVEGWDAGDHKIASASRKFEWDKDTVRFNNLAGAHFPETPAKRITVSLESLKRKNVELRYLIDDLAFVSGNCDAAVALIEQRLGGPIGPPRPEPR